MQDYVIEVNRIEELQNTSNTDELDKIFSKAKSAIVNGALVILTRKSFKGSVERFDEFSTLADLNAYKQSVFKYL